MKSNLNTGSNDTNSSFDYEAYNVIDLRPGEIAKHTRQIRNLKKYKNYTVDQLHYMSINKLAFKSIKKTSTVQEIDALEEDPFGLKKYFSLKKDILLATSMISKYLEELVLDNDYEKDMLIELVWFEVSALKMRQEVNKILKEGKALPKSVMEQIEKFDKMITDKKMKLGIIRDKSFEDSQSPAEKFNQVIKRCQAWAKEHGLSRTIKCPHCARMIALKMRTDKFESTIHPYFIKDKLYWNKSLYKFMLEGRVSKLEMAAILYVAPEYIDWMEKHYSKELLS